MEYVYLICPFVSLISCQLLKSLGEFIKYKRFNIYRLINGNGGMPSTHTAFVSAITMLIGFKLGFDTPLFALAFTTSFVISYDAMGVRQEAGKHAKIINNLINEKKLKEELGHKALEVIVGYIYGTLIAFLFSLKIS